MIKILCAAICNPEEFDMTGKPLIYCGHRHNNILWQGKHVSRDPYHQGFLTSEGTFASREIAANIASIWYFSAHLRAFRTPTESLSPW